MPSAVETTTAELTLEVAQLWPTRGQWTEADYFALPDTNRLVELSKGELIMPPPPTHAHQLIVGRLYRALHAHVVERGLGVVQFAPLPVRLWPGKIREPDILFVSHEHADRIGEQFYGPPDLVIEVLSAGTWRTDRLEKMVEYAQAGVVEYWIVDPEAKTIEVFVLREGAYTLLDRWGTGEIVRSALLEGLEIAVNELFDRERM